MIGNIQIPKIRISISDICNLECVFCGGSKYPMENWRINKQKPLKLNEILELVKVYKELEGDAIHITGGEPLLNPDYDLIIREIVNFGINVELNTNGTLLNNKTLIKLKHSKLNLLKISLHSIDKNIYRQLTKKMSSNFETIIKNSLEYLDIRINVVVFKSNYNQIIPILDFLTECDIKKVHLLDLTYYSNWISSLKDNWINEYISLQDDVVPMLISKNNLQFSDMNNFGCLFLKQALNNGLDIILKCADQSLRHPFYCNKCTNYCHEGMFTIRVSFDGYINICPMENEIGFDLVESLRKNTLKNDLMKLIHILNETVITDSWQTFLERNNLKFPKQK